LGLELAKLPYTCGQPIRFRGQDLNVIEVEGSSW